MSWDYGSQGLPGFLDLPIAAAESEFRIEPWARSCRLLMVMAHEPTQSLTAWHAPGAADACIAGEQQDVVLPLMIALSMVMLDVFAQCAPQRALAKEDYLGQALLLYRPDPALRIGIVESSQLHSYRLIGRKPSWLRMSFTPSTGASAETGATRTVIR